MADAILEPSGQQPPKKRASTERREAAIAAGEKHYLGAPCCNGHAGWRFVSNYWCIDCTRDPAAQEKKRRYDSVYNAANRDRKSLKAKEWQRRNPDKRKTISATYTARRRQQKAGGDATAAIHEWKRAAKKVCFWCGAKCGKNFHIDHFQPLSKGGLHELSNLVIACPTCNVRKNAKDPYEFAASLGRLF